MAYAQSLVLPGTLATHPVPTFEELRDKGEAKLTDFAAVSDNVGNLFRLIQAEAPNLPLDVARNQLEKGLRDFKDHMQQVKDHIGDVMAARLATRRNVVTRSADEEALFERIELI